VSIEEIMADIAILDFGSQFTHMASRRLRNADVRCDIFSPDVTIDELKRKGVKGVVLSGGPSSVYAPDSPDFNEEILRLDVPILGICYGFQLMTHALGGQVLGHQTREFGRAELSVLGKSELFQGTPVKQTVWMSHGDVATRLPVDFMTTATTRDCPQAAAEDAIHRRYGVQFHPEVVQSAFGKDLLVNFAANICGCPREWRSQAYLAQAEGYIRDSVGSRSVFLLVSGGIDSVVVFELLNRVLGPERVKGLFIDTGLLREGEADRVKAFFKDRRIENFIAVDASDEFLDHISDLSDPEAKRTAVGELFLDVKDRIMEEHSFDPNKWVFAQGTIYPDIVTSGGSKNARVIKTHHNALPSLRALEVVEPLRHLYKDEVRELAAEIGLPGEFIKRHPFPGPGLAVRIAGRVTTEKLRLYHEIDAVVARHVKESGWQERLWMGFPILVDMAESYSALDETALKESSTIARWIEERLGDENWATYSHLDSSVLPIRSVGVKGDYRSYEHPVQITAWNNSSRAHISHDVIEDLSRSITNQLRSANRVLLTLAARAPSDQWRRIVVLRMLISVDTLTSDWAKLEHEILDSMAEELQNNIAEIDAVLLDVTQKPPGTMEWE